ncbi:MAG: hypothetical protein HQ494_08955 [Rhodospirillales bacterium]|nr:hypothetical protein [Rhodospirillales bacterium]
MEEKIHDPETERFLLLLRREVQRAAERLIKVRPHDALKYAIRQAEFMGENERKEEQVYWEKISIEIEKQQKL